MEDVRDSLHRFSIPADLMWTIVFVGMFAIKAQAQRLVPPQNLGLRGTLWSVPPQNFCRQMLLDLDPKLMLSVGLKTQNRFLPGLRPGPHWVSLHHFPDPLNGLDGSQLPLSKNPLPTSALWDTLLHSFSLNTVDSGTWSCYSSVSYLVK